MIKKCIALIVINFAIIHAQDAAEKTTATEKNASTSKATNASNNTEEQKKTADAPTPTQPPPKWPFTLELDKADHAVKGDYTPVKKSLYKEAQSIIKQAEEAITSANDIQKKTITNILQEQKKIKDFILATSKTLGKIKEELNQ